MQIKKISLGISALVLGAVALVGVEGAEASSYDKYQDWVMTFQPAHHSSDFNSYKELRSFVKDRSETYISRAFGDEDGDELEEFVMEYERVDWEDLDEWFEDHGTPDKEDDEEEYYFIKAIEKASANGTIIPGDNTVTSAKIVDGTVTSADIADGTVVGADLATDSVGTSEIADGSIVNADVNASAAIAASKVNFSGATIAGISSLSATNISAIAVDSAGFSVSGTAGYSGTLIMRDSAGTGTCTITVSGGIITASTCL